MRNFSFGTNQNPGAGGGPGFLLGPTWTRVRAKRIHAGNFFVGTYGFGRIASLFSNFEAFSFSCEILLLIFATSFCGKSGARDK